MTARLIDAQIEINRPFYSSIYGSCPSRCSDSPFKTACIIPRNEVTYFYLSTASWPSSSSSVIAEHQANNFILLRSKIRRLPLVHQAVLKALLEHLGRVVAHSEKNKMDPKNLAIVFGSVIFGEDEMPKGGDLLSVQTYKVMSFDF